MTYVPTPDVAGLAGINTDQRLYVIEAGGGYSCLGFDVAKRKAAAVAAWLKRRDLEPPDEVGTGAAWIAYLHAMDAGAAHNARTGERATFELCPVLAGLEGKRVEVREPGERPRRFWVGKSTGWAPCHLEIPTRASSGGFPAMLSPGAVVRVVDGSTIRIAR